MASSITSRSGSPVPVRMSPNRRAEPDPAEQCSTSSKKTDEQTLPKPEIKSGQENLQRFLSVHGKAGNASGDDGTSADANVGADIAAESSGARRRASRVRKRKRKQVSQIASSFEAPRTGGENAHSSIRKNIVRGIHTALKVLVSIWAVSSAYRLLRPSGNVISHPGDVVRPSGEALKDVLTFKEQANEQTFHDAKHAVLERFGSYIPEDSHCYNVRTEMSSDLRKHVVGTYNPKSNTIKLLPGRPPRRRLATAIHEYCHCFTHPKFRSALAQHPRPKEINEALTEHIKDKYPTYGLEHSHLSKNDSSYDTTRMRNGKRMVQAAQELEDVVGEATLMRAYFSGDKEAIRKISSAAIDIFPKRVARSAWMTIQTVHPSYQPHFAECFAGALLSVERKIPFYINDEMAGQYLSVSRFSLINAEQQKEIENQVEQMRQRLGSAFDHAFYNFDETAAEEAMKAVHEDLRLYWKCVLPEKARL